MRKHFFCNHTTMRAVLMASGIDATAAETIIRTVQPDGSWGDRYGFRWWEDPNQSAGQISFSSVPPLWAINESGGR
jgi:hypothetical protein